MYKPLPHFLSIEKSGIHGVGVFTKENLLKDICLGVSHIRNDSYPDGMIRTPLGGFLNHADHSNCELKQFGDLLLLFTSTSIPENTELTVKYGYYF